MSGHFTPGELTSFKRGGWRGLATGAKPVATKTSPGRMYDHLRATPPARRGNSIASAYWYGYDHADEPCPPRLGIRSSQVNQAWRAGRDAARRATRPA